MQYQFFFFWLGRMCSTSSRWSKMWGQRTVIYNSYEPFERTCLVLKKLFGVWQKRSVVKLGKPFEFSTWEKQMETRRRKIGR